jgi:hypothetical protein
MTATIVIAERAAQMNNRPQAQRWGRPQYIASPQESLTVERAARQPAK